MLDRLKGRKQKYFLNITPQISINLPTTVNKGSTVSTLKSIRPQWVGPWSFLAEGDEQPKWPNSQT